jgi:hypothetical protein
MSTTRLNLLPYLQNWDGVKLDLRLLMVPRGSPLDPLVPGLTPPGPSFATASFVLDVRLVKGLDQIPSTGTPSTGVTITPPNPGQAQGLFNQLATVFRIDPTPSAPSPRRPGTRIQKYLPPTYREATGFSVSRTPYTVSDKSYHCMLHSVSDKPPYKKIIPPANPKFPWGKVIAIAMRQPLLTEQLGIVRPLQVTIPTDFFKEGGWLYVTLAPTSDGFGLTSIPDAIKIYAARVPPLSSSSARTLFTPVLFPVTNVPPPGPYDDLFQEAENYDDGFAKAVHAVQPQFLDPLNEDDDGTRPAKDIGIRLGWDDEQVAIWLNRQIDPAAASLDAPMGVFGYRIDAREEGEANWSSLCLAQGAVKVGSITVGTFNGELAIETIPNQPDGDTTGVYWLPSYYTQWAGRSLVAVDTLGRQLMGDPNFAGPYPVTGVDPAVLLRYGKTYQFRVRLMDHTGGGPGPGGSPQTPGPKPVFTIPFRRWIRPRSVRVLDNLPSVPDPANAPLQIHVGRPLLGYPEYVFTNAANAAVDLISDLPAATAEKREVGLPDPDVATLKIDVQVRALGLDDRPGGGTESGYHTIFTTTRPFPTNPRDPLTLDLAWTDVHDVDSSMPPVPSTGPIPVPTARFVRLVLSAIAKDDPQLKYFGASDVRFGARVNVNIRRESTDERGLFLPEAPADLLRAIFLQPSTHLDAAVAYAQRATGKGVQAPANPIGRLAEELDLSVNGLTLHARSGRRLVFGASAALRHILAPDNSSITFASNTDLTHHWIVVLRATIDRDWTWDGLGPTGVSIVRQGAGEVGRIEPRPTIDSAALVHPDRAGTDLIFFDVVDPKPEAGHFPSEMTLNYSLTAQFISAPTQSDPAVSISVFLPMTTPPAQVPRLVSAGLALSPYLRSTDYSSTEQRRRVLWLEFDRPPENPRDLYFGRIIAYAPDPLLVGGGVPTNPDETAEPPLPVDPEPIRTIVPGQSDDRAGFSAMQELVPSSDSPVHFMLPLPSGMSDDSPELFGFYTYEFRVGHNLGWSTAQGRFGAALRVTGVQHPAPPLTCTAVRTKTGLIASAPYANPVQGGRSVRRFPPATQIYVMLYAQVYQSDSADFRNVLLSHRQARFRERPLEGKAVPDALYADASWSTSEISLMLAGLTLESDTPLSCLAVETLPGGSSIPDPLGAGLGQVRILRTSPLVPVPAICLT